MSERDETALRRDTFGLWLKSKRLAAGVTQAEIARDLKYSTAQFVSNWERGVALPPLEAMPRLAELLGIVPQEMIDVFMRYQERVAERQRQHLCELFAAAKSERP